MDVQVANAPAPIASAASNAAPSRSLACLASSLRSAGSGTCSATHFSSSTRSRAVCQRSSGSFARQRRRRDRAPAASAVARVETGGGSSSRIAAIRLAWRRALERPLPVDHLVEHRAEREDVACARRPRCPRAAPAPCTGTCRAWCPARSAVGGVVGSVDSAVPIRRRTAAWRARSRAASRRPWSASRCRA